METARPSTLVVEIPSSSAEPLANSTQAVPLHQLPGLSSPVWPTIERGIRQRKTFLQQRAAVLIQPTKKVGPDPTVWQGLRAIVSASYLNVLLVFIPISWALNFALSDNYTLIFVLAFLAIIPLANLLAFATDELSIRVGQALGGLINITLGNTVELIIAIVALAKCELDIVQSSLVGSILSNLLPVLGTCFFAGGLKFLHQGFGLTAAQMNSTLLTISVITMLLPSAFVLTLGDTLTRDSDVTRQSILKMSHGASIILLFVYASYLFFQLFSHRGYYQDDGEEILESKKYTKSPFKFRARQTAAPRFTETPLVSSPSSSPRVRFLEPGDAISSDPESGQIAASMALEKEEETQEPRTNVPVALGLVVIVTALIAVTAEFLVDSISGLTDTGRISKQFVAIILLPIVGNAAEHITEHVAAVRESMKDKLMISLGVAVGSSIQITLFVIPFIVTLGWILGKPLTLLFDPLQSVVVFLSVLTVNHIVQDGKSNWLDGLMLICIYIIVCVTFWYYPGTEHLSTC